VTVPFISVNEPLLDGREKEYLIECIDSGWVSSEGPFVGQFEERIAARVGRRYGVAVTNGTAALEAAVAALGISAGDEVILTTFTIISCALAVIRAGARPVFVDVDPDTWNMDITAVESAITERTRAVMAVHTYGLPVDMDPLLAVAGRHGLAVIEDAAQMLGQEYRGRPCGRFGDVSCFSFYPNKHVTTGEGGMLVTDDPDLAERCRSLRNLCFQPGKRFVHEDLGWNLRMSNVQAAIGLAQLERLDDFVERKRAMGRRYNQRLSGAEDLQLPLPSTDYAENIYWVYGVVLGDGLDIDAAGAMQRLAAQGIGTRPFFWPMHEQPVLQRLGVVEQMSLPVAERIARRGFYLPSGLALDEAQIDYVTAVVCEAVMR
jgi:perosamine synthetase